MERVFKILVVLPSLNKAGGIEKVFMNYYQKFDKNFKFDFITHECDNESYKQLIKTKGDNLFVLPKFSMKNLKTILKRMNEIMKNKNYDIIHCHMANAALFYFKIAKKYGIKNRILHGHLTDYADIASHRIRNFFLVNLAKFYTTDYMACGNTAGKFLTKKDFYVMNNCVDINTFKFNDEYRKSIRSKYNIGDEEILLGHVGRLNPVKNQKFILDILSEYSKFNSNVKCIIVGSGPLREELINYSKSLNIGNKIIFVDSTNEVYKYYQAFDCFLLPSFSEGVPTVAVEAQCSNLFSVLSNKITKEVKIADNLFYLDIKDARMWANFINDRVKEYYDRNFESKVLSSKFNVDLGYKNLQDYYKSLMENKNLHIKGENIEKTKVEK